MEDTFQEKEGRKEGRLDLIFLFWGRGGTCQQNFSPALTRQAQLKERVMYLRASVATETRSRILPRGDRKKLEANFFFPLLKAGDHDLTSEFANCLKVAKRFFLKFAGVAKFLAKCGNTASHVCACVWSLCSREKERKKKWNGRRKKILMLVLGPHSLPHSPLFRIFKPQLKKNSEFFF